MLVSHVGVVKVNLVNFSVEITDQASSEKKEKNLRQVKKMVFYNDNSTNISLSLRHHAQEPPVCFQYHHLLFVLCAVPDFP